MDIEFKVKVTKTAKADIRSAFNYIKDGLKEPEIAKNIMREIDTTIIDLKFMPGRWGFSLDETLASRGYHRALVKRYVILFLIDEAKKIVTVTNVFHGTQDYAKYV